MSNKLLALLLAGLLLGQTGCSLAQAPKETPAADRLIGVYVVGTWNEPHYLSEDENWVEYGSFQAETEWGTLTFPQRILPGRYEGGTLTFPGLEGYSLAAFSWTEDGESCVTNASGMADTWFHVKFTDEGEEYDIGGTVYYGAPLRGAGDNVYWRAYQVYQTEDGAIYTDGSGNSYGGSFSGGEMSFQLTEEQTVTVEGETSTQGISIDVTIQYTPRLTGLVVRQYSGDGQLLQSDALPLRAELPAVAWLPDAAWCLVEEVSGEGTVRTAYDRPGQGEDPVSHQVILLDDEGMGHAAWVNLE